MSHKLFFARFVLALGMLLSVFGTTFPVSASPQASIASTLYDPGSPTYTDIWVDPIGGNDISNDGTSTHPFLTLTHAWESLPTTNPLTHAFRINLQPGTYSAAMIPNYWDGHGYGTAVYPIMIRGNGAARGEVVLQNTVSMYDVHYVYFENLIIRLNGDAFHCELCDHILLRNMVFDGGTTLENQAQETIKINQSQYVFIENNDISGAWDNAIDYVSVQHGHVIQNKIHDARDWCEYAKGGSAYLLIEANTFYNCGTGGFTAGQGTGFQFMSAPWIQYEAYDIKVVNNIIHDTDGAGLGVNGGYDILMAYNTMYRVGARDHILEAVFGSRSCDGVPGNAGRERCQQYLDQGGWGTTIEDNGSNNVRIPNKNVFIYNNVVYNPPGFHSAWQQFAIYDPYTNPVSSHVPTAVTDDNLQIRGNVIWNNDGINPMPLGIENNTQACVLPYNSTCNAAQLIADNAINTVQPQFVNAASGDFHLTGTWANSVTTYAIPSFPAWDIAGVDAGNISNAVLNDFEDTTRATTNPPGAYYFGAPIVASVVRVNSNPTNVASVDFTATFSKSVAGVNIVAPFDDFAVTMAGGVSGAFVTGVTVDVTGSIYTVSVNTGSGNGTIRLDVLDDDSIVDAQTTPLNGAFTSGQTYVIDKTAPTILSITRAESNPTSAIGVDFTVTFDEPVTGVASGDFSLDMTGVIGATVGSVRGSGATRTVTVNTGTGDGAIRLDVLSATIIDLAGNSLAGLPFTSGAAYTVDKSITRYSTAANDGWVLESREFSNVAGSRNNAGNLRVGDDTLNRQYRSLLYFDTSSLPNKAKITKVTLRIEQAGTITGDDISPLGALVADMKKGLFGLTPLEFMDFNAAADPVNTGRFTVGGGWYQLRISPLYFKYINVFGAIQFRLRFTKDDNNDKAADFISFYSGDAALDADKPQLLIEYSTP